MLNYVSWQLPSPCCVREAFPPCQWHDMSGCQHVTRGLQPRSIYFARRRVGFEGLSACLHVVGMHMFVLAVT